MNDDAPPASERKEGVAINRSSRFKGNVARIAAASVVSQGILFSATAVLTRLCTEDQFGAFAVFSGLLAIVAGLFTLKYDLAIVLPKENQQARELTAATMLLSIALSGLFLASMLTYGAVAGHTPGWQYLLLPLGAVLAAGVTCGQQWAARAADYAWFSRSQVLSAVVNVGTAILLCHSFTGWLPGLLWGFLAGQASALIYLVVSFRPTLEAVGVRRAIAAAIDYKRFPLYVLPSMLLLTLTTSIQPWLLEKMFSLGEVGQYAIANRVLLAPSALIGAAVSEAFRAELVVRLHRGESVTRFFSQVISSMTTLALLAFIGLAIVGEPLFTLVFGERYGPSGHLVRFLAAGALAQFVVQPLHFVFIATGRVQTGLFVQIVSATIPTLFLIAGARTQSMENALLLYSFSALALACGTVVLAYRVCSSSEERSSP